MAKKDIKFTLDTIDSRYSPVGTVKQLDSVFFYIKITENGVTKDLTGQTIKLFAIKEDKKIVEQTTKINITNQREGLVEIELLNAAIQVHGFTYFELEISDSNGIISTADFILRVNKRVGSAEAIESTNEVSTLKEIELYVVEAKREIKDFKKLQDEMLKTNESINFNENERVLAESKRVLADEKRTEQAMTFSKKADEMLDNYEKSLANITNGNESATNSEIVNARGKFAILGARLKDFDSKITEIEKKINYITPELFGAIGDGENDDTQALLDCFNYANENFINVKLQNKIYQSTKMIKTNGCYDIEGRNSIIKAIGEMDILFLVDKTLDDLNNIKNKGISFIDGINFEGREFANTTFYIKQGSRIKVRDITTLGGKIQSCLLGNSEGLNLWELDMAHCRFDASCGSGKQGKYALKMEGSMSDNSLNDILCINGSENWAHIKTASSFITKMHGYSYPEDIACDVGFYVYGSGTYLSKVVCDTPRKIGMVLDGNASTVRDISIGKYVEKVEDVTGVKVISNFNVIDGVFTNGDNVTMITLDTEKYPSITDFKYYNLITQTGCKRDIHVTGKLPYRLEFDKKVSSVTDLFIDNQFLFHNQTFYVGSPNKDITFKIPLSSALYTVNLYEITGKSIPKYKIYNATNTGFSISILGEYTENLIVKIKVDMDY
ncbi:phage baseplate upper protein [Clostridium perfringens]|uniref:phage baseplate upper protein n=1 Tax=Clostridium perfringens TaxID=1502 RepID=UPI001A230CB2|nr:phage baseplate upper protein [Clostridium perfringens]UYC94150.1 phage baseplate upper protein [Clostridium perfringens]HAT4156192.1 BppU family phage baseplate upper protein [Clostridium perfringens]